MLFSVSIFVPQGHNFAIDTLSDFMITYKKWLFFFFCDQRGSYILAILEREANA